VVEFDTEPYNDVGSRPSRRNSEYVYYYYLADGETKVTESLTFKSRFEDMEKETTPSEFAGVLNFYQYVVDNAEKINDSKDGVDFTLANNVIQNLDLLLTLIEGIYDTDTKFLNDELLYNKAFNKKEWSDE